ncbi:MAG: zinc metalloprotease HtpX [Rubricoccaceae bacterium]|nr:zinc metalloprotease HtpX [Rubricoccaceae bacterium]
MTTNALRTAALMAGLITLFALIGGALGGQSGLFIAFGIAVALNFGSYWFSDKLVLKMQRGQEITEQDSPELVRMVDRLRQRAGLPMPKVYIIPSPQPNAFATGRNPEHAAVAFTEGILRTLQIDELEGVTAHELAHIKHRDILTSTIAATLASAITLLARFAIFIPIGGRNSNGGGLQAILMLILAPIAAMLIQMAISRSREFAADRGGAEIAGSPNGLANALLRLEGMAAQVPAQTNPSSAHLFIVNPFAGRGGGFANLFRTHPPTEERVSRLRAMA